MAHDKDPGYTSASVKVALSAAKTVYEAAVALLKSATPQTYDALRTKQKQAQTALDKVQDRYDKAKDWEDKKSATDKSDQNTAKYLEGQKAGALERLKNNVDRAQDYVKNRKIVWERDLTKAAFDAYQDAKVALIVASDKYVDAGGSKPAVVGTSEISSVPSAVKNKGTSTKPAVVGPKVSEIGSVPLPTTTPTTPTTSKPTTTTTSKPTTPTTSKPTTTTTSKPTRSWQDALRETYPSYSDDWLTGNAATYFGQDTIDLFTAIVAPNSSYDMDTAEGRAEVVRAIQNTNYWKTTQKEIVNFDGLLGVDRQQKIDLQKRDIAATYGDLGFDDATLTVLATNAARKGLTGLGLKQAVYGAAFARKDVVGANRAGEGADADRIKKMGREWGVNVSPDIIQAILTGLPTAGTGLIVTENGLREQLQKNAIGAYSHLKDQIDAGSTLEGIAGTYRDYAAQVLEKDPGQVDMFSGPFMQALSSVGADGKSRQLGLGEWVQRLRTDSAFGYQFTKQANQDGTNFGLSLAKLFGKIGG